MSYEILYQEEVKRFDIPKLSPEWRVRIKNNIEKKLTTNPEVFGKPLRRSLKGYRKLRISDWRVIFRIEGLKVKIFVIGHRSIVYTIATRRLGL